MENERKEIIVAVSGGFDPIHPGHVRLINEAKKLGDKLIVILNNDNWLRLKKGKFFMSEGDRREVLMALASVDDVVITCHEDGTCDLSVSEDLRRLRPHVFANGGDRKADDVDLPPSEYGVCDELGIKMVFNVGEGGKINSSSDLLKKYHEE